GPVPVSGGARAVPVGHPAAGARAGSAGVAPSGPPGPVGAAGGVGLLRVRHPGHPRRLVGLRPPLRHRVGGGLRPAGRGAGLLPRHPGVRDTHHRGGPRPPPQEV
ncbi:MAG: Lycopene cyclase, partial [uncultured Acidimicrobiales bacterium]